VRHEVLLSLLASYWQLEETIVSAVTWSVGTIVSERLELPLAELPLAELPLAELPD